MNVYIDIIFVENLLMNYIILYGTGFIQKDNMKSIKLIIASLIGAMYAIISYLKIIPIYSNVFIKILLSIIICYIAFTIKSAKKLFKTVLLFYLVSFATAGLAIALIYLVNPENVNLKNGVFVGTYPMKMIFISGALGFVIIQYSFKVNKRIMKNKELICDLIINVYGKNVHTKAFIDSGNNLRDPLTNKPVVIIEKEKIQNVLPFMNLSYESLIKNSDSRLRLIPFKSIGKQNGMLVGIKANFVKVIQHNGEENNIYDVTIGLYENKIGNRYDALIGLDLLENNKKVREKDGNSGIFKKSICKLNKLR